MSRRALTMAAVFALVVGACVPTGAAPAGDSPLRDASSREAADRDSTDADSRLIPPRTSDTAAQKGGKSARTGQRLKTSGGGWGTTLGGLAAVLALVFLSAKVLKKSVPAAQKTLPPEVVQVLGRKALDYRHTIHLVRFGSRMLMVGASQEGMTTLSEITDPVEIDYLAGLCKPSEPASVAHSFNQLFQRFQNAEPPRTEVPPPAENETAAGPDLDADRDAETDSDPAILRLQERLHKATRTDPTARPDQEFGNGPQSTEVRG